jgi:hypothetical protein
VIIEYLIKRIRKGDRHVREDESPACQRVSAYDENMVIHFHRYSCMPSVESLRSYLEISERLNQPLWLGETGESIPEWFAALYPLAVSLDIGYNL